MVFQLEVYYKEDRLLTGLTVQQKGTTAQWYSNKTSLVYILDVIASIRCLVTVIVQFTLKWCQGNCSKTCQYLMVAIPNQAKKLYLLMPEIKTKFSVLKIEIVPIIKYTTFLGVYPWSHV